VQDLSAKRTLVKSPPELWSELSEVDRLARHLEAFGEIEITRLEPERTVAWEGEAGSGTVSIEPSGWGTRVTLTAHLPEPAPAPEPEPIEPDQTPVSDPPRGNRLRSWLRSRRERSQHVSAHADQPVWVTGAPAPQPEPAPPPPEPEPDGSLARADALAALERALEALGSAHHRPFSRG
jgi:hypothetical protein